MPYKLVPIGFLIASDESKTRVEKIYRFWPTDTHIQTHAHTHTVIEVIINQMDASSRQIDEGIIFMEGWLYLIRSNTIGFKYSRKLYYVLQNHRFMSFKSIPHFCNQVCSIPVAFCLLLYYACGWVFNIDVFISYYFNSPSFMCWLLQHEFLYTFKSKSITVRRRFFAFLVIKYSGN